MMLLRACLISTLTALGIYASPLIPERPVIHPPSIQDEFKVMSWGLQGDASLSLSPASPEWWKQHFKQQNRPSKEQQNFIHHHSPKNFLIDLGDTVIRNTDQGLRADTLIRGPHNETLRYSTLFTSFKKQQPPTWWPRYFEFYGGTRVGIHETAFGRLNNSTNLIDKLPTAGKPWVKISEDFYIGAAGLWWAFVTGGEIRIIKTETEKGKP